MGIAAAASLYGVGIVTDAEDSPHLIADRIKGEMYFGFAEIDEHVPANVIPTLRKTLDQAGTRYKIADGATMNLSVSTPVLGGQAYAAVENLFDAAYQNPTATSVRNLPVESFGRTVTVGYRKTF